MATKKLYISSAIRAGVYALQAKLEQINARQLRLLSANDFEKYCKERGLRNFWNRDAELLWQVGLLHADVVLAKEPIQCEGLVYQFQEADEYLYTDERRFAPQPSILDVKRSLPALSSWIRPYFHPYRYFVMYWLDKCLRFGVTNHQPLVYSLGYESLVNLHLQQVERWFSKQESAEICDYRNDVAGLCAVMEPGVHRMVFNSIKYLDMRADYKKTITTLEEVDRRAQMLLPAGGEGQFREWHRELCQTAEMIDENRDLHTVIRLMSNKDRERVKGEIGGAYIVKCMAETLRRVVEERYDTQWKEEDESGFGIMRGNLKPDFYGADRLLDGSRVAVQQFLRQMGLDYSLRMVIYVEGETEFAALRNELKNSASVDVVNLRGQFVERGGRGLAFRESLRRDLKNKLFSMILLDGDRSDNLRVVKSAAKADEFCGRFFVCEPDFEYGNFSPKELFEIVTAYSEAHGIGVVGDVVEETISRSMNGKELMENLQEINSRLAKGSNWGNQLLEYAVRKKCGDEFGDHDDRVINQLLALAFNSANYNYEVTRQKFKTCPDTGKLIER